MRYIERNRTTGTHHDNNNPREELCTEKSKETRTMRGNIGKLYEYSYTEERKIQVFSPNISHLHNTHKVFSAHHTSSDRPLTFFCFLYFLLRVFILKIILAFIQIGSINYKITNLIKNKIIFIRLFVD